MTVQWTDSPIAPFIHNFKCAQPMRIEYTVEMVPNVMAEAPLKSHLFYKMDHWKKVFSKKAVSFAPGDTLPSGGLIGKTHHDLLKMVVYSINVVLKF